MAAGSTALPRSSFLLGLFSMGAQIIVLRECLVSFYGSELSLGTVLACWLLWVGAGSLAAGQAAAKISDRGRLGVALAALQVLAALSLPLTVLLIRAMPHWAPLGAGELPSPGLTAAAAALFTSVAGSLSGGWFALAAFLPAGGSSGPGKVYTWEALGALAGGIALTLLAAGNVDGMEGAVLLSALTATAALLPWTYRQGTVRPLPLLAAAALVLSAAALLAPWHDRSPAAASGALRWPGQNLVSLQESPHGHLALTDMNGQKTLYENGVPSLTFPGRRAEGAFMHLTLLAAPQRRRVLLIGGGLGGSVREILLHPVGRLDYLEADPRALETVLPHLPPSLAAALEAPRLKIIHDDARHWLRRSPGPYDIVAMNLPEPSTALLNRFYTVDFFRLLKDAMAPEGLLAFTLPASPNYRGGGLARRNRSVYGALKDVFGKVTVLSGNGALFLAGADGTGPSLPDLAAAAEASTVTDRSARSELLGVLLDPARSEFLRRDLEEPETVNSDGRPTAYFYHVLYWGALSGTGLESFLEKMTGPRRFLPFLIPLALLAVGTALAAAGGARRRRMAPSLTSLATGWAAMSFYFLILFSYQSHRGYLYFHIGLLTALFMVGMAGGGFASLAARARGLSPFLLLKRSEKVFLLWCVGGGAVLLLLAKIPLRDGGIDVLFLFLSAGTGSLAGFQFPLLTGVERAPSAAAGGRLYFFDLAGSAAGALLTSLWLLPLLGIGPCVLFAALLKLSSLTALAGQDSP